MPEPQCENAAIFHRAPLVALFCPLSEPNFGFSLKTRAYKSPGCMAASGERRNIHVSQGWSDHRTRRGRVRAAFVLGTPARAAGSRRLYDCDGLLAYIVTSKFSDYLPLYRLEDIFERQGFEISRATQSIWCGDVADLAEPLYELMAERVRQSHVVATDDTIMPMLSVGKTKSARMWVYVGDEAHAYNVFDFTLNRGARWAKIFSEGLPASVVRRWLWRIRRRSGRQCDHARRMLGSFPQEVY